MNMSIEAQSFFLQLFGAAAPVPSLHNQEYRKAWEDFFFDYMGHSGGSREDSGVKGEIPEEEENGEILHEDGEGEILDEEGEGEILAGEEDGEILDEEGREYPDTEYDMRRKRSAVLDKSPDYTDILDHSSTRETFRELVAELAHRCEELLLECFWRGSTFDCCRDDDKIVVNKAGVCVQVRPPTVSVSWKADEREEREMGGRASQKVPGSWNGLTLLIDPGLRAYDPRLIAGNELERGVHLIPTFNPKENNQAESEFVGPGRRAWVKLERRVRSVTAPKWRVFELPCRDTSTLRLAAGDYTEGNCFVDCQLRRQAAQCGCVMLTELRNDTAEGRKASTCYPGLMVECWQLIIEGAEGDEAFVDDFEKCVSECLPPCRENEEVRATASSTRWLDHSRVEHFTNGFNAYDTSFLIDQERASSLIWADVFYSRLDAMTVETVESTPVASLVSNIGGTLGLWLGASMLTAVQTIYYLCACGGGERKRSVALHSRVTPPPPLLYS